MGNASPCSAKEDGRVAFIATRPSSFVDQFCSSVELELKAQRKLLLARISLSAGELAEIR
jgi:hypothetical protein